MMHAQKTTPLPVAEDPTGDAPAAQSPPPSPGFDYHAIPEGYYDRVLREGNPIRRLWHLSKFERVLDCLPQQGGGAILDIGCFAGTFLSMVRPEQFERQLGVDILPGQIEYANANYGTPYRRFRHVESITQLAGVTERFDCVTLVEVIEHLDANEIRTLLREVSRMLRPGGRLVLTTPNYASTWPILERILNRLSEVSYEEQHITRFTYFNMLRRLTELYPALPGEFSLEFETTTHFVTPFLAGLHFESARRLSRMVPHTRWRHPFGNLVLMVLDRRS